MEPRESFDDIKAQIREDVQRLLKRLNEFEREVQRLEQSYRESSGADEDLNDSGLYIPSWEEPPEEDISTEEEFVDEQPDTEVVFAEVYANIADLRRRCERLIAIFEKMRPPTTDERDAAGKISQFEQHALQAFTELSAIQAELTYVQAELRHLPYRHFRKKRRRGSIGPVKQATSSVATYIKQQLFPLIKKISTQLYNWIVQFVTPKGWSIGGEIGVNLVFQSSATLQINFGP